MIKLRRPVRTDVATRGVPDVAADADPNTGMAVAIADGTTRLTPKTAAENPGEE
jgi:hypothetical protein